jgi:hypothetical protein
MSEYDFLGYDLSKDTMMLWADHNIKNIFLQIFPNMPPETKIQTEWFVTTILDDGKSYVVDMKATAQYISMPTFDPEAPERGVVGYFSETIYLVFHELIFKIGEEIRQLNELRTRLDLNGKPWVFVSPDYRYAELLERQKIHFVKVPLVEASSFH